MTLDEIVTFCRKNNILVWKGRFWDGVDSHVSEEVELHFGPPPPPEVEPEEDVKGVDKEPTIEKRRGKDGKTAAQQIELYGRVIDAEE